MPNINLADERKRDAVVKAESVSVREPVRYLGPQGGQTWTRRVLKSTIDHDHEALLEKFATPEAVADALVKDDPEVDVERFGQFLWNTSKVYMGPDEELVFHVRQFEEVRGPGGKLKDTRERERDEPNVDGEVPLQWTGKFVKRDQAIRQFIFTQKLQVVHINGLTYDFLYGMARDLDKRDSLMLLGAGSNARDPLVFRRGSIPYRGFLEGRVEGDRYVLLLHLSNMELKKPAARRTVKRDAASDSQA